MLVKFAANFLLTLLSKLGDVVWVADMNFQVSYISPSVKRMLGETVEEHLQKTMEQKFPPQALDFILKAFQEEMEKEEDLLSDKHRTRVLEVEHYKADGKTIWISMHISALRDDRGIITGFQGVVRDISERKKIEKLLQLQARERAAVDAFTYSAGNPIAWLK